MARDTFNFNNVYSGNNKKITYNYEVEFILLPYIDTIKINDDEYNKFLLMEKEKEQNKQYDLDVNIRDLYPISIHTDGKNEDDVKLFERLNKILLDCSDKISRRVVKKSIVYKKNKCKRLLYN